MLSNEPTFAIAAGDIEEHGSFLFFNLNPAPLLICLREVKSILTPARREYTRVYSRVYSRRHMHEEEKVFLRCLNYEVLDSW